MILKVNKDICEIKQNEVWNVGDYNVHTVEVELSEEFDGLVNKVRYFTENNSYDMLITDNVAQVPYEATVMEGTIKIGVYGYDADTDILVQSTSPVNKYITSGTYTGEADNTEPLTPTDKEQMETAIQKNTNDITDLKANKQDKLISGVNIKTINNESILSSGNLTLVTEETDPIFTNSPAYSITDNDITYWNNKANMSDIPDVSNFITKDVDDLTYYTKSTDMQIAINNAVGNERTARENADNSLQNQIDAITVSSDVVDVVSTYQDLVDYDTQHIKANDIIKVMQDSTHNNAISYYRWVIVNHVGSWEYVGSEGPYYTKSETDILLNAKQNTLVSGQNIKTINNESLLGEGNINIQSGGTSDYTDLTNKPKINNVELVGNKTLNDLGIQPKGNYALESDMTEAQNDIENLQTENERLKATLPTTTGEGQDITLDKTAEMEFVKPPLPRGNSEQNGEPSPDNEVPITNVTGNVEVTISNNDNTESKTLPVSLGNIELCKLGDYQDYLYKNNGKWYKYNAINKLVLNGSENWTAHGSIASWFFWDGITDGFVDNTISGYALSNYFTQKVYRNVTYLDNGEFAYGQVAGSTRKRFVIKDTDYTTVADFKSWLSNNNVLVYYVLATPTDTEITDATLISQLEEISKTLSYQGQTNITSNTIALFNVEAYQDTKLILVGKANKISVVQTSASTIEINPNTFYKFGEVASLNITLASITDNTIYNEYMFEFVSGTTATTLTLPSSIKWLETPTIDANRIYQCSIVDNIGLLVGVTNV